jgi:hypothetical protein
MVIPAVEQMNRWITRDCWSAREGQWVRDAPTSAGKQGIRIHMLEQAQEMSVCVELQQRIWGYAAIDTVPDQIVIVAKKTGGQVVTAY